MIGDTLLRQTTIGLLLVLGVASPTAAQDSQRALAAFKRSDYPAAFREWLPLAEKEHANAQFHLGLMYENGLGVPQDYSRAASWYGKAASQGHKDSQNNLAFLYLKGLGVKQNHDRAMHWYRKAAENRGRTSGAPLPSRRGEFQLQLGSVKSKIQAMKEAQRLNRIHRSVLGNLEVKPVRVDLGKRGVYYRLRTTPIGDRASAGALCREISHRNQNCIVTKP
jgi:hypothetical protein